jgi:hypothetical protein
MTNYLFKESKLPKTQNDLDPAIQQATEVVKGGKCAVIEVA